MNLPAWRKSGRSNANQNCVEVASNFAAVELIRDSKLGDASPILSVAPATLGALTDVLKGGRLHG